MEASARLSCCRFRPLMPLLQRSLALFAMAMAASVSLTAGSPAVAAPAAGYRATVLSVGDGDTLRVDDRGKPHEVIVGTPVYLDIHVKLAKDWQKDPKKLRRLGF